MVPHRDIGIFPDFDRSNPQAPRTERAAVFVFAADHGLVAEGVSLYPASVTRAMVATYLAGRAGVNALAKASGTTPTSAMRSSARATAANTSSASPAAVMPLASTRCCTR
jgi:NaMN:DMB phosphoribosyltransferase